MMPQVTVVVLNWNGLGDTLGCLKSLSHLDYPRYRVLVVDNGSTDGSPSVIRERFPGIEVMETGRNLGYAGGNNIGVKYALQNGADYVFIVNNDTEFHPRILTRLVETAEAHPRAGAVGPKIYYHSSPQRVWFAGGVINWRHGFTYNLGTDQEDHGQSKEVRPVDFLAGCALLIRRETWERVGPFDARFFMYWEEVDWCVRARRTHYELLLVPEATMWHKTLPHQTHSPYILYYMTRNRFLFLHKHVPFPQKIGALSRGAWGTLVTMAGFLEKGQRRQARAMVWGLLDFLRGKFGPVSRTF
ncbi:MAG: glycosyltransferase family 2 protein [Thermoflexales bacterium]|nr:glycosyltransferase family 2 protein [Thermoflexales bacterium]